MESHSTETWEVGTGKLREGTALWRSTRVSCTLASFFRVQGLGFIVSRYLYYLKNPRLLLSAITRPLKGFGANSEGKLLVGVQGKLAV